MLGYVILSKLLFKDKRFIEYAVKVFEKGDYKNMTYAIGRIIDEER